MGLRCLKKYWNALAAIFLMIGVTGLFFVFPGRYIALKLSPYILGYIGVVFVFVLFNYFLTGATDPGTYPKRSEPEDDEDDMHAPVFITVLIHDVSVRLKWCSTCNFYRPPRVSHCSVCDGCIDKFDHHCPWVNNCVGRRNYRYFCWFLLLLTLHMAHVLGFAIFVVIDTHGSSEDKGFFISSIVVAALDGILCFPVYGLFGFHVYLASRGRTTNEQVTGKFRGGVNPFDHGCPINCFQALCSPQLPKPVSRDAVDYTKYRISPPYLLPDTDSINTATLDNIKESTCQPSIELSLSRQSQVVSVDKTKETAFNVPHVEVIPRNGSLREELNTDRFRAKVTPVVSSPNHATLACVSITGSTAGHEYDTYQHSDGVIVETSRPSSQSSNCSTTQLMNNIEHSDVSHQEDNDAAIISNNPDLVQYISCREETRQARPASQIGSEPHNNAVTVSTMPMNPEKEHNLTEPKTNTNNCSNQSDVCESGYSSRHNPHEIHAGDDDDTTKIQLEIAMRDIEANVALLNEAAENSKIENISQKGDCVVRPECT